MSKTIPRLCRQCPFHLTKKHINEWMRKKQSVTTKKFWYKVLRTNKKNKKALLLYAHFKSSDSFENITADARSDPDVKVSTYMFESYTDSHLVHTFYQKSLMIRIKGKSK